MINANETRFDNWFYDENGKPKKFNYSDFVSLNVTLRHYSAIPLTHELLEKCGLKKEIHVLDVEGSSEAFSQYRFSIQVHDCILQLNSEPGYIEMSMDEKESPMEFYPAYLVDDKQRRIFIRPIYFLHELQNLYSALTGKELSIDIH